MWKEFQHSAVVSRFLMKTQELHIHLNPTLGSLNPWGHVSAFLRQQCRFLHAAPERHADLAPDAIKPANRCVVCLCCSRRTGGCASTSLSLLVLLPPWTLTVPEKASEGLRVQRSSSGFYEELFWSLQAPVPLAGAFVSSGPHSDVVKQGYLGKLERNRRRYFVLRAGSHTGPSRLEWYRNREKFTAAEKSAGRTAPFGSSKAGTLYLRCCLGVSRIGDSRRGHTLELYAKDRTLVLLAEDRQQNQDCLLQRGVARHGEASRSGQLQTAHRGEPALPHRHLPRLGPPRSRCGAAVRQHPSAERATVRTPGRPVLPGAGPVGARRGRGDLDGGEAASPRPADPRVHSGDGLRALRALPDLGGSPASGHSQRPGLLASKRCRHKPRDRPGNARPPQSRTTIQNPQTSPALRSNQSDDGKQDSTTSDLSPSGARQGPAACNLRNWGWSEGEEPLGYMVMSPQAGIKPSAPPPDDYVTMESPQRLERTACSSSSSSSSSLHTTFSSLACDSPSSLHAVGVPLSPVPGEAQRSSDRSPPARVWRASCGSALPDPDLLRSAVRRSWLPPCFLSCLKGGDRS
ncbi:hypothetical protein OJAV_G00017710 [Oryzias javanicus]|uniref:PH domain-containing protein n=1 Tax=Oryzias javanicus TaxID=123683 RepID=A0A437DKW1_ORYJA|nr:hypothetical protein OJAV_G00017710 [Oryzias javanicus]